MSKPNHRYSELDEQRLKSLRWLYDDDAEYERAVRAMKREIEVERMLKAAKKQRLTKRLLVSFKATQDKFGGLTGSLKQIVGRLVRQPNTKRYGLYAAAGFGGLVLVTGAISVGRMLQSDEQPVAKNSSSSKSASTNFVLGSQAIAASNSEPLIEGGKDFQYDPERKTLTYGISDGPVSFTVTQQALPEQLRDPKSVEYQGFITSLPNRDDVVLVGNRKAYLVSDDKKVIIYAVYIDSKQLTFIRSNSNNIKNIWQETLSKIR